MTGLALHLAGAGSRVSGSVPPEADRQFAAELEAAGIRVARGSSEQRVRTDRSCAVWSSAVIGPHPELDRAQAMGLPLLGRSEALAALVDTAPVSVAVAGNHSTVMAAGVLTSVLAYRNPGWVLTAAPIGLAAGHASGGGLLIADLGPDNTTHEAAPPAADCYPSVLLVVGVDANPPHSKDLSSALDVMERAARRATVAVLATWDHGTQLLAERLSRRPDPRVVTVGCGRENDVRLVQDVWSGIASHITVQETSTGMLHQFTLAAPGRHHALAATAAFAAGLALGARGEDLGRGISDFRGIDGCLTTTGSQRDVTVMASRARHPEEIAADLAAARQLTEGRVLAVFEPDGYTRTDALAARIGEALAPADQAFLLPVHTPLSGIHLTDPRTTITSAAVAAGLPTDQIRAINPGPWEPGIETTVADTAGPGDLVLTIGNHRAPRIGPRLLFRLAARHAPIPMDL